MTARHVDWKKVEQAYRAGMLSVEEIARQAGITAPAIHKHAKKNGWTRDLTAKVRARSGEKQILAMARLGSSDSPPQTDEEIIEDAALTQIAVVQHHQVAIRDGHRLCVDLFDELRATTTHRGQIEDMIDAEDNALRRYAMLQATSLPKRAETMRSLTQSLRTLVQLERQAFGIADLRKDVPPGADMTTAELEASIRSDIAQLFPHLRGQLEPPDDPENDAPEGVAPRKAR